VRCLRTGYTHWFSPRDGIDRAAPAAFRERCRSGDFQGQTSGCVPGFVQANFVALPREHAFDFLRFTLENPRACPLLDVTAPGDPCPLNVAPKADLRTDLPSYRVWSDGVVVDERADICELWDEGMVGFLLGCSFSWEGVLQEAGLTPRQIEEGCNVPMYATTRRNKPVGPFGGRLVVSMRPYRPEQVDDVVRITEAYPGAHGGPVHWGAPEELGIASAALATPDWGDAVSIHDGEVPVFWACGVTPQAALMEARLPLAITHAPGHMFVTDLTEAELQVPRV